MMTPKQHIIGFWCIIAFILCILVGSAIAYLSRGSTMPPAGPDCDVTVSDRMGMVIIRLKQAAPCDLAALRERAAAELARPME